MMKRILTIFAVLTLTTAAAQADKTAEGDALYEQFAHWSYEHQTDSVMVNKDAALTFFAVNLARWIHSTSSTRYAPR